LIARPHINPATFRQPLMTNIGFTLENTPKLLDFGLARIVDSRVSFEESGDVDPGASAPRCACARPRKATWERG
jgi:hypothetical protein